MMVTSICNFCHEILVYSVMDVFVFVFFFTAKLILCFWLSIIHDCWIVIGMPEITEHDSFPLKYQTLFVQHSATDLIAVTIVTHAER